MHPIYSLEPDDLFQQSAHAAVTISNGCSSERALGQRVGLAAGPMAGTGSTVPGRGHSEQAAAVSCW
jgi:hypothetical protein